MEQPSGAARCPIRGADTSTTALLAAADRGPLHEPVRVTGAAEAEAVFGPPAASPLTRAVTDFVLNGGAAALAVRTSSVRAALAALSGAERFQLLVVDPAVLVPGDLSEADAFCEERRAFLVAEAEAGGHVPPELVAAGARNAAVYYPRLLDAAGVPHLAAPNVAGVFARNDHTRGVWKASAGHTAEVVGAAGVEVALTDRQLGQLTTRQVNVLRRMPDGAVVVWGDRTVSPDPEWKYVNVRRHLLCVEHSIEDGLQWVASATNDEALWAQVRADVGAFLLGLWRHGAFPGERPSEAFWVRCDTTTMTPDDVAAGRLVVLVGVATVRPAEFVTLRVAVHTRPGAPVPVPADGGPGPVGPPVSPAPTGAGPAGRLPSG